MVVGAHLWAVGGWPEARPGRRRAHGAGEMGRGSNQAVSFGARVFGQSQTPGPGPAGRTGTEPLAQCPAYAKNPESGPDSQEPLTQGGVLLKPRPHGLRPPPPGGPPGSLHGVTPDGREGRLPPCSSRPLPQPRGKPPSDGPPLPPGRPGACCLPKPLLCPRTLRVPPGCPSVLARGPQAPQEAQDKLWCAHTALTRNFTCKLNTLTPGTE